MGNDLSPPGTCEVKEPSLKNGKGEAVLFAGALRTIDFSGSDLFCGLRRNHPRLHCKKSFHRSARNACPGGRCQGERRDFSKNQHYYGQFLTVSLIIKLSERSQRLKLFSVKSFMNLGIDIRLFV